MKDLQSQLQELEGYISNLEEMNATISKVSVGWHIDHSLRVVNGVIKALEKSDSEKFEGGFNFFGSIFLTFNFLPRGRGRAPKLVQPEGEISAESLKRRLDFAYSNYNIIVQLDENTYFKHPLFGDLKRDKAVKFIRIHTDHHLKIIREILA